MASGGARARSGPAPDPNALRRDRKSDGEWVTLPAEGRQGEPPEWPLLAQSEREAELWAREWRRPQAVMWERNGQEIEVALYVRRLVEVETPEAPASIGTLVKQMQEALGLNMPGLARNRWRIAADELTEEREQRTGQKGASARERFTVVRPKTG